jgi:mannose-6-phosphate isomerase-like protein (cupin superfamily)
VWVVGALLEGIRDPHKFVIKSDRTYELGSQDGQATWFAGALMVRKAGAEETDGRFDLMDQTMPPGYAVPRHVHHGEDEAWYILEGEMTFYWGDREIQAGPQSWVFAPKDVAHTFKVGDRGARALTLTSPSGFARFVEEFGVPARELTVPPPGPLDEARLLELARKYNFEVLGPPPT